MKKLSFLFAFAILALASCKKNEGSKQPITYMVNGITDIFMFANDVQGMGLNIDYRGPVQENVALSITGLPEGVTAEFSTTSGIPTFNTSVAITSQKATVGTYPLKLVCKGSSTGEKSYDFTLTIKPVPCTQVIIGNYSGSNTCIPGSSINTFINFIGSNNLIISNVGGMGFSVNATVNCDQSTINIPSQDIGGAIVSGTGSFVVNLTGTVLLTLNYTYDFGGGPTSCTAVMSK